MEDDDMSVSVLIGLDYMCQVLDGRMKRGESGPVALGSRFGWILSGPAEVGEETARAVKDGTAISNFIRAEKTCDALQDLWELEGIGISSEGAGLRNQKDQEDQRVMEHFQSTLQRLPDGRYQTCAMAKNQGPRSSRSRIKYTIQDPGFPRSHVKYTFHDPGFPRSHVKYTFQDPGFPGSHVQYTLQDPRFPRSHVRYTFQDPGFPRSHDKYKFQDPESSRSHYLETPKSHKYTFQDPESPRSHDK